eukprot:scaffold31_cov312-Prasinococcus_capsulatus_cf.AAC.2
MAPWSVVISASPPSCTPIHATSAPSASQQASPPARDGRKATGDEGCAHLDALDEHGHAGQLAVERNALPGAARVAGVQQDGWLAHDPTCPSPARQRPPTKTVAQGCERQ